MQAERWQQLDQLFHSALQLQPGERAALLDKECAGDEGLRRECETLLAAHEEAGSFIEKPALNAEAWTIAEDQNRLSVGQTIGHYRIISQLGAGGMGEVYLAEDAMLGRKVALKLLPADFTRDIDRVRRFQQEAHAASALNHPNIVTVYEIAHNDDRHLIATEFIDGETLRERIRESRSQTSKDGSEKAGTALPILEVLNIGIQIADALAAAHEAGIVHRDIKPENIMVRRRDGYIKVLDFGLAKLTPVEFGDDVDTEAATRLQVKTSAGLVMGTVIYMSPEQVRGEKVDQRTDLWSLGVVLYELLAGCVPFDRPTPSEVIAAVLDHDPPPLSDYVRDIPSEFERIISKALTKDRESRYQTAKDLLVDLRHLQHCWEADKEIEWSSSDEARNTQPTGTSHQAIGKALKARLFRARIDHRRALLISVVVIVLVIVAVIYRVYFSTAHQPIDSIAVLPLVNATNDPKNPEAEYWSDGISESLINSLAELQQLKVIARQTSFRYKGKDVDPQAVGRELDVRAVLMGRMRQIGDTLSIQVDLVDTATGAQLWGREYERKVSDLLSVKQLIAREVTGKLGLGLSGEQQQKLNKGDTTNSEAYQSYVRGVYFWRQRSDLRKAIEQFQQAITLDPNYALAYVGIASSYLVLEQYGGIPASETLPKARAAVERALAIDDSLAEAHTALGSIEGRSWNFDESEREYIRAIVLNPNSAQAHHWYGINLRDVRGRFDEALAEIKIAQRLDPLSPGIGAALAGTLFVTGERVTAFQEAKKLIELDPTLPIGHWTLGILYRASGRYEEAIAEEEKAVELSRRASLYVSELGACYAAAGKKARALELLKEVEEKYNKREATGLYVAYVYVALGDKDQAFAWLEKDFQARSGRLPQIAHFPMWENLRDDPRFKDLLRRMGLPQN